MSRGRDDDGFVARRGGVGSPGKGNTRTDASTAPGKRTLVDGLVQRGLVAPRPDRTAGTTGDGSHTPTTSSASGGAAETGPTDSAAAQGKRMLDLFGRRDAPGGVDEAHDPHSLEHLEAELGAGAAVDARAASQVSQATGADLSDVRVHRGSRAEQKASEHGAAAFTVGKNIIMGANVPAAGSPAGDLVLSHELVHAA